MHQIYFLSIFANLMAGVTLSSDYLSDKISAFSPFKELFSRKGVRGGIGALALIVGFLKLLIRSIDHDVPVVGDFLPALAGIGMGAVLLFELFKAKTEVSSETMGNLEKVVVTYKVPLGLAGAAIGLLHFLLPGALFL
ncbi:hypothetical protein ES707_17185 [subsurface metagenome]